MKVGLPVLIVFQLFWKIPEITIFAYLILLSFKTVNLHFLRDVFYCPSCPYILALILYLQPKIFLQHMLMTSSLPSFQLRTKLSIWIKLLSISLFFTFVYVPKYRNFICAQCAVL